MTMKPEDLAAICKQAFEDKFKGRRIEWVGASWNTDRGDCYRSGFEIGYIHRQPEIDVLKVENANLKTVMVAAAEEIHEHWSAHCDVEGYGPANLMRRLECGIPAEYGYTAGAFAQLKKQFEDQAALHTNIERGLHQVISELRAKVEELQRDAERLDYLVRTQNIVFFLETDSISNRGWCVLKPPNNYLTKGWASPRDAVDAAIAQQGERT